MDRLKNKVVFITGGTSGIGKAAAIEAAREGALVAVADLETSNYAPVIQELETLGTQALFVPLDVASVESVKLAIKTTVQHFGRLDVAFNNAGIGAAYADIHEQDEATWRRILDINLTGVFYCVKYQLQQFLQQGGGVIVNMSSIAGLIAEHGLAPYTAAKHGVLGLTKNIAVQYGSRNIRGNALCPYYIDTPLIQRLDPTVRQQLIDDTPAKRLGQAVEIAKAFIFLASDEASYCNGTHLTLDGGALA